MTEIMPVPRKLRITVLPAGGIVPAFFAKKIARLVQPRNLEDFIKEKSN